MDTEAENEEVGLRPIGSLLPRIVNSLTTATSSPTIPLPPSGITGSPKPARAGSSSIGRQPGATGAVAIPRTAADVAAMVLSRRPDCEETDKALSELWTQRLGRSPVARSVPIYDDRYGYMGEKVVEIARSPHHDQEVSEALDIANSPARPEHVTAVLARLRVLTVGRAPTATDGEAWFTAMADELENYPRDVVIHVCREWSRQEKWTPSAAELIVRCDQLIRFRRMMRAAHRSARNLPVRSE